MILVSLGYSVQCSVNIFLIVLRSVILRLWLRPGPGVWSEADHVTAGGRGEERRGAARDGPASSEVQSGDTAQTTRRLSSSTTRVGDLKLPTV